VEAAQKDDQGDGAEDRDEERNSSVSRMPGVELAQTEDGEIMNAMGRHADRQRVGSHDHISHEQTQKTDRDKTNPTV